MWSSSSSVEQLEGVGVGLAGLPGVQRDRDREAGGLPAAEADVEVDLIGLVDGDVFDQQADDAFAFSRGGGRVGPELREVGGELADLGFASAHRAGRARRWSGGRIRPGRLASARSVSFQSASRVSATSRLSGSTAR